jgi:Flp pilus assembly protein TadG
MSAKDNRHDDRGYALTMFTVAFTLALVLVVGLVVDGGAILAERRRAISAADAAARIGAADVGRDESGRTVIDTERARQDVAAYLGAKGVSYEIGFNCADGCSSVVVTVHSTARLRILGGLGLSPRRVSATISARPARGTTTENPSRTFFHSIAPMS